MAVNVAGAVDLLEPEGEITLSVQERPAVYCGLLIDHQSVKRRIMDSSVHRVLRAVLDQLSPLHLTDPNNPSFQPENCAPIQALWNGFTHPGINWSGTVQFDGSRFLTRLAASEFGPEPAATALS